MIWQSWKITEACEPVDDTKALAAEALRAVRDFRDRDGQIGPAVRYLAQINARRNAGPPVLDLEGPDPYVEQMRWFTRNVLEREWHPWYDQLLNQAVNRRHHEEPLPSWDSRWMTGKLDE